MGRGMYYAARAAGRAAVREQTRARQARERAQAKNPEQFKNEKQELSLGGAIFVFIFMIILLSLIFS